MKLHTPLFIIGLLTFITPVAGLPDPIESYVLMAYGIATMIIVSTIGFKNE
jgi:hypothetical protein